MRYLVGGGGGYFVHRKAALSSPHPLFAITLQGLLHRRHLTGQRWQQCLQEL